MKKIDGKRSTLTYPWFFSGVSYLSCKGVTSASFEELENIKNLCIPLIALRKYIANIWVFLDNFCGDVPILKY